MQEIKLEEKLQYPLNKEDFSNSDAKCDVTELKDILELAPQPLKDEGKDMQGIVILILAAD